MAIGEASAPPQYVLLGHLTLDRIGDEYRCGGTVLYSGVTAMRLGYRVGMVTAADPSFELPAALESADVRFVPSDQTTTYELTESERGRTLRLRARARELTAEAIPESFRAASVVQLAPVSAEVPPSAGRYFPDALVGVTPQGWLRTTQLGIVTAQPNRLPDLPLDHFGGVVLSLEDVGGDLELVHRAAARTRVLVLTRGSRGSTLYVDGRAFDIPAVPAHEVEPTGAGDVFAAAFFIRLRETSDPFEAARFASGAAAIFVEGSGAEAIPSRENVNARLREGHSIS